MTPNESLLKVRQVAEAFLHGHATQDAFDVAIHEASVLGCDMGVLQRVCEIALERVVAAMQVAP
jgi:hypothetical protein